jgi:hypothetical protein
MASAGRKKGIFGLRRRKRGGPGLSGEALCQAPTINGMEVRIFKIATAVHESVIIDMGP